MVSCAIWRQKSGPTDDTNHYLNQCCFLSMGFYGLNLQMILKYVFLELLPHSHRKNYLTQGNQILSDVRIFQASEYVHACYRYLFFSWMTAGAAKKWLVKPHKGLQTCCRYGVKHSSDMTKCNYTWFSFLSRGWTTCLLNVGTPSRNQVLNKSCSVCLA